jgi:hypothetical protein
MTVVKRIILTGSVVLLLAACGSSLLTIDLLLTI